jgi:putative ABC transport system permease protein
VIRALLAESLATARSQPVASALTILMVAGMILAVMLTTGRTVGAEQQVLSSIDSAGTRMIFVRSEPGAGLNSDVLDRIATLDGVQWAGGFSSAMDVTNAGIEGGSRVPARYFYGRDPEQAGLPSRSPLPGALAWASSGSLDQLGMPDASGSIALSSGEVLGVAGRLITPDYLAPLEPVVLIPRPDATGAEPLGLLLVLAESPGAVGSLSDAVFSVLAADDASKISVQTSEALAALRAVVQGQLSSFSRGLVLALLGLMGALVAVLLFGLVSMKRKDFGRRRALGASRALVVALVLVQTGMLAACGVAIGLTSSAVALAVSGDPLPGPGFAAAMSVLTVTTTLIAALTPAIAASRRDPLRELRVP